MAISQERYDYLHSCWADETEDACTEIWRDELTDEELVLVDGWDSAYLSDVKKLLRAIDEAQPH